MSTELSIERSHVRPNDEFNNELNNEPTAEADRHLRIALNQAPITRSALCRLAQTIDAWRDAASDDVPTLAQGLGIPEEPLRRALGARRLASKTAERELARTESAGCHLVTLGDADYPPALFDLALPPPVLTVRGDLGKALLTPAVSIVGARRMDGYGREAAGCFAAALAAAGVAIVSGFARGLDAVAHRAAATAPGGATVAVLGCGLDIDYPRHRGDLRSVVAENGALISEFPLGREPRAWHFPVRNRVIAALGKATLVIQAKLRSGSLITAHHALELGRDIYAVPGRIFDVLALGTNALIADGALVATCPEDLLEALALPVPRQAELFPRTSPDPEASTSRPAEPAPPGPRLEGLAGKVWKSLEPGHSQTAEDLAGRLETPVDRVLGALLELELGGFLRREPGPVYVR